MGIKLLPDVGAPAVVGLGDILMKKYAPAYEEYFCYGLTAIGYIAAGMNLVKGDMGDFFKNLAVSSLPLTVDRIYTRVTSTTASRVSGSRMALHPATQVRQAIRQTTVPEFSQVRVT